MTVGPEGVTAISQIRGVISRPVTAPPPLSLSAILAPDVWSHECATVWGGEGSHNPREVRPWERLPGSSLCLSPSSCPHLTHLDICNTVHPKDKLNPLQNKKKMENGFHPYNSCNNQWKNHPVNVIPKARQGFCPVARGRNPDQDFHQSDKEIHLEIHPPHQCGHYSWQHLV